MDDTTKAVKPARVVRRTFETGSTYYLQDVYFAEEQAIRPAVRMRSNDQVWRAVYS